jgi:AcrR family transcriptional regulator
MVQKEQKAPKKLRGRPRAYDPEQALARVMDAFWRAGYSGTSLDQLSAATGMNRPSLYGAFGDKRALYLTTMDRYIAAGQQGMEQALRYDLPLGEALTGLYERALALYLPEGKPARGCFLVATAGTEAVADAEVRARLGNATRGIDRAFEARLRHAQKQGELDAAADPALLARVATGVLHTLAVRARAGDARASLRATANAAVDLICAHRPAKTGRRS